MPDSLLDLPEPAFDRPELQRTRPYQVSARPGPLLIEPDHGPYRDPDHEPDRSGQSPLPRPGRAVPPLRPLQPATLLLAALVGVVIGLLYAIVVTRTNGIPPTLTTVGVVSLGFVVLALAIAARYMSRVARQTGPVDPHVAVRILALGRAGAVVGAVVAGVYVGIGIERVTSGLTAGAGGRQLLYAGLGTVAGLAVMAAGLVVEHACRRPDDPDDPGPGTAGGPPTGVVG